MNTNQMDQQEDEEIEIHFGDFIIFLIFIILIVLYFEYTPFTNFCNQQYQFILADWQLTMSFWIIIITTIGIGLLYLFAYICIDLYRNVFYKYNARSRFLM